MSAALAQVRRVNAHRTAGVRRFEEADIPQVAALHQRCWPDGVGVQRSYRGYFTEVFLENPAQRGPARSLVYHESDGRIVGFLGIVPRRMAMGGRHVEAAVSSQFIVDPASAVGLVALKLSKTFLEGPQDVSIADEANDVSRIIWEGLGGTTARLLSLYWTRPLRPAGLALSYLRGRRPFAPLATVAQPFARLADACAARLPGSHFRQSRPAVPPCDLYVHEVLASVPQLGEAALRVEHDERNFQWLLDRAAGRRGARRLLTGAVKDGRTMAGWYIAVLDRDGVAEVAQVAATPSSIHDVLDHLFHHAWREGALAATGRMEPRFMQALSDRYCLFHRRGPWVLVKARYPELVRPFETGDAWFSPFDGEWSLRFQG